MTKNKHKQQPISNRSAPPLPPTSPTSMQIDLGYNPNGPKQPVDIVSSKDGWSEFALEDGTVIRTKAAVLDVQKLVDQYNADGEPIYMLQLTMINQTRVPDNLKKKS
jgi:hypothetical protein